MKKKNILIADVFSTLFDGVSTQQKVFADTLGECGVTREAAKEYFYQNYDKTLHERFASILPGTSPEKINKLVDVYNQGMINPVYNLSPGVVDVFNDLKKKGVSVIVISDRESNVLKKTFDFYKLRPHFMLSSNVVKKGEKSIWFIKRHLGFTPTGMSGEELSRRAMLISGEEVDMQLAKHHDLLSVGICNARSFDALISAGAGKVFSDIRQILPFF